MYLSKILATKGTASFFSNQKLIKRGFLLFPTFKRLHSGKVKRLEPDWPAVEIAAEEMEKVNRLITKFLETDSSFFVLEGLFLRAI